MGRAFEFRKGRKLKRWGQMSKTFSRIGKDIVVAIRAGGPNPESNGKLRAIIQNAKAVNMPKENIERALKKAVAKDTADYKEIVYEGYGPHGIAVVVECTTDNPVRTVAGVRSAITRAGGSLGTSGMLDFMFDRKCVFHITAGSTDAEELELEMIDVGADEVFAEEDQIVIYGGFTEFGHIQQYLESNNYQVISSGFERIPTELKDLTPDQEKDIEKMIEKLEDDDDVQMVYHNMRESGEGEGE
ncbi:MAG: YebC/PmpR family DNA-binding transcriptional regulator [Bacteroidota bacterium]